MAQITLDNMSLLNRFVNGGLTRTSLDISQDYLGLVTRNLQSAIASRDAGLALDFVGELIDLASSLFAYMFVDKAKQLEDALSEDDWSAVKLNLNSLMGLADELEMAIEVFKEEEMY